MRKLSRKPEARILPHARTQNRLQRRRCSDGGPSRQLSRRSFLAATGVGLLVVDPTFGDKRNPLAGEVGVTTSSFSGHLVSQPGRGQFSLLELPRILRNELDMRVIDLNTSVLASEERKYLQQVRDAADKAGCILTNLKMNQRGLDMSSRNQATRDRALAAYKRSIDSASTLGLRWARPLPTAKLDIMQLYIAGYRELADYAAKKNVQMLVENYGWMQDDANSIPKLIKAIGKNIAACPDTGNWNSDKVRFEGLQRSFPMAVTCDFKARALGPNGEHKLYSLKRCYQIGKKAGFNGPWCLEHANRDRKALFRELAMLRDMICKWSKG